MNALASSRAPIEGILRSFESGTARVRRQAVERAGDLLRESDLDPRDLPTIGKRLVLLAYDDSWEVRKAVAHAIGHLRHDSAARALERLLADDHALVVNAAKRARDLRRAPTQVELLNEEHQKIVSQSLFELGRKYGPDAPTQALQVAYDLHRLRLRAMRHETLGALHKLRYSLDHLSKDLAQETVDRRRCRRHLDAARVGASDLTRIVDDNLSLTGDVTPEYRSVRLRDLLKQALSLARSEGKTKSKVVVRREVDPKLEIVASRHHLIQAFTNVAKNALRSFKGLPGPHHLDVEAIEQEGAVIVRFRDDGCGMTDAVRAQAFQAYSSGTGSTGLGLSLALWMVKELHGGRIELESEVGKGTTVSILLPKAQD